MTIYWPDWIPDDPPPVVTEPGPLCKDPRRICVDVECENNLIRVMTARGESSTRCLLAHIEDGEMSPFQIGKVLGLDDEYVAKIVAKGLVTLRRKLAA